MSTPESISDQNGQDVKMKPSINSPTACATPIGYNSDSMDLKPRAPSKDSGISQVFFPDDFDSDVNTLSPIWNKKDSVPVVTGRPKRIRWIKFVTFWMIVVLVAVLLQYYRNSVLEIHTHVLERAMESVKDFLPHLVLVCAILVSSLLLLCYDCFYERPLGTDKFSGVVNHEVSNVGTSNVHNVDRKEQYTAKSSSRDFPCRKTFS
ncbi:hypothetical protein DPMN_144050 [Dreissena polymorpha]|uniref:Uncharacterized protein n=1 Tax=Dreissena polymorpha TaxID=45954 RepID=A0A9D4JNT6_DREPO|nr:hypothetical protein DPMN_144050 [Dreissena polymorpha]